MKKFYDDDADLSIIQGRTVAVIGRLPGPRPRLSLRDSGVDVRIGLAEGSKSRAKAEAEGLRVVDVATAAAEADLIMILTPDQVQADVYDQHIAGNLQEGDALFFAHGFNVRFGYIQAPRASTSPWSPKGPGHVVRREFEAGRGVPALIAVEKDASGQAHALALSYAKAVGGTRAGVIETTFTEETETDLFGEQAVLCGGASQLVQYGFETLTEAGYQPEIAYFEVLHELKLIVDLMVEGGIAKQRWSISDTAEYGDYVSGPRVITPDVKENMKAVLADIQSGAFAQRFMDDQKAGAPEFKAPRPGEAHPIEKTGRELRQMFSWLRTRTTTTPRALRPAEPPSPRRRPRASRSGAGVAFRHGPVTRLGSNRARGPARLPSHRTTPPGAPVSAAQPVVLIAEELSPATVEALGPDFEIRRTDGADRARLLEDLRDVDAVLIRSATDGRRGDRRRAAAEGHRARASGWTTWTCPPPPRPASWSSTRRRRTSSPPPSSPAVTSWAARNIAAANGSLKAGSGSVRSTRASSCTASGWA
ncbi:ketol-acid reductoisomerase [Micrococcus luteus]|nr:ketol-acid reductoisomerase [Micrococcus luteus]